MFSFARSEVGRRLDVVLLVFRGKELSPHTDDAVLIHRDGELVLAVASVDPEGHREPAALRAKQLAKLPLDALERTSGTLLARLQPAARKREHDLSLGCACDLGQYPVGRRQALPQVEITRPLDQDGRDLRLTR
ncbi:MAG: hypothetical protein IPG04_09300 [Polyangiaceae bacterium]|nr:hypothetical protein [Polyangiaceae bacterium]